ncbi:MSCRAMM family protein [Edaphobacter aggregans]|uniref:MSCRAMM family protein n=1 Tax=Edaphobacter aggregans TaxID=570835 RepID=UPI0012FB0802|nr:carboxypeptidase-like regulatory domain-containing protein [Edaphobacter aggregans]
MRLLSLLAVFLVLESSGWAQAPGAVTGHLYCEDTHTPCRFVSVTIQAVPSKTAGKPPARDKSQSYSAMTDMEGAYQINDVAPGEYYILAHVAGYITPYDIVVNESKETPAADSPMLEYALNKVTVDEGQTVVSNLTMSRGAAIEGVVRYEDGAPAINVTVHLLRRISEGRWKEYLNSSGNGPLAPLGLGDRFTDDRGRFYFPGLPPGVYTVEASLREYALLPRGITGKQSLDVRVTKGDALKVYFGNKCWEREAVPMELRDGEVRSGADIEIPSSKLHALRGTVTARTDGSLIRHGRVRLLDPNDKVVLRETETGEDGMFVFHYVVGGSYLIEITATAQKGATTYEPMTSPLMVERDESGLTYAVSASREH